MLQEETQKTRSFKSRKKQQKESVNQGFQNYGRHYQKRKIKPFGLAYASTASCMDVRVMFLMAAAPLHGCSSEIAGAPLFDAAGLLFSEYSAGHFSVPLAALP